MKRVLLIVSILLFLLVAPVILAQSGPHDSRNWQSAELSDLSYEEVTFSNEAQQIELAGLLFRPAGDGPFPGVVFVHGAGDSYRENRWFATVIEHLLANGVAVLLPDKRGSVQSGGDWRRASFADLGTDTVAAVAYLRGRSDLPLSVVGIIGSSQGGHIAPLIAAQPAEIDFIIDLSGSATGIREVLLYEEQHNLRQMGLLPPVADLLAYPAAWSLRELRQKEFWTAVGDFDPLPYWRELQVPGLVLYGAEDSNVPVARSVELLSSLENERIRVVVYQGSGHNLETPSGEGDLVIRQEALDEISGFILSQS